MFDAKAYNKEYRKTYNVLHKKDFQNYYQKNKKRILKRMKKYYQKNKEEIKNRGKNYRKYTQKERQTYNKKYYILHRTELRLQQKEYSKKHNKQINKRKRIARKINISYRIRCYLATRMWGVLKGNYKSESTIKLLGCSVKFLKRYLQKQFKSGMTWKNWGKDYSKKQWHIDHIIPCCRFDLSKPSEQKKCFNYKNLQPLWALENLSKR